MLTKFASWFAAALAASLYAGAPMHAGDLGTPLAPKPVWTAEGEQVYSSFGNSVASAGDVNGDGYADVVVGAPFVSHGESFEGRAFVYYGSAKGLPTLPDWIAEGDLEEAQFGSVVASAGDVNGDGYDDVLVGAPTFDHGKTSEGRAFLYLGSANGLALTPAWHAESHQKFARFGAAWRARAT